MTDTEREFAKAIGETIADSLKPFLRDEILPIVVSLAGEEIDELYPQLELFLEEYADNKIPELLPLARLQLVGLTMNYKRPWWARLLGLPEKIKIGG